MHEEDEFEPYEAWNNHLALLNDKRKHWFEDPKCLDIDMFPTRQTRQVVLAQTVCTGCPLQLDCLYMSLVHKEEYGVWGGTTEGERDEIISKLTEALGNYAKDWRQWHGEEILETAQAYIKSHEIKYGNHQTTTG